ncbi:2-oxo acid dehydrogenase subunit E2 [Candidatus Woesearchaeota archaeon]|nr:2-oxo acid dehydrogenase subunit E2 [Candidatus Woesearchaeota archaeon]
MPYEFKFPDVGEGIHEGEIVKWKVKEGDKVTADQHIVEIETDKAVVDIPCPKAGTILKISHKEGETIQVGEILVVIGEEGEKAAPEKKEEKAEAPKEEKKAAVSAKSEKKDGKPYTGSVVGFLPDDEEEIQSSQKPAASTASASSDKAKATPAVRILARNLNVDISSVAGSGPGGRITEEDIEKAAGSPAGTKTYSSSRSPVNYESFGSVERVPLKGVRKAIHDKMHEAHNTIVPITNFHDAEVSELDKLRSKEKKAAEKKGIHMTFMPFIIKAVAKALANNPMINSCVEGSDIILKKYYNIGVAVDTDAGLIVPVVKNTDEKDIFEIAKEVQELAQKAKDRKLSVEELKGGSFTVTNLGSVGVRYFTPMVNYPESCILGLGSMADRTRVDENGKVTIRKMMPLSFTYDHRVVDGAVAARFMNEVISYLEDPALIFIEEKGKK